MDKPFSSSHVRLVVQLIDTLFLLMINTMESMINPTTASFQERKDKNNVKETKLVRQPTEQESKSDSTVPVGSRYTLGAPASEVTPSPPPAPTSAVSVERLPAAVPAFVGPAQEVCDEVCPDTVYASANGDDFGNDGSTAFRCFQCRMLYIPEAHREGNIIKNYELCQRHIGVLKCDGCAKMIVGMAKIRCHRQVCPLSA